MTTKHYVVTLHNFNDLDSFYEDMETPGGNLYIPGRAVELIDRRPVSRNTHYLLTDDEANTLRNDPRVLSVELDFQELDIKLVPCWTQTSDFWNKSNIVSTNFKNWGILRCVEGYNRSNWGSDYVPSVSGTVTINASGKNVDLLIVDGHIDPLHPEFAVNSDGTGGSRVVQYNWFQHSLTVAGISNGTYTYTPYVDGADVNRTDDNDHGAHVAGTAAGNTFGWARNANIYNLNPYATNPNFGSALSTSNHLDYIKVWHQNKPINPVTGIRNPTISNHSYGFVAEISNSDIVTVRYRGVTYTGPFTSTQLQSFGIYNYGDVSYVSVRSSSVEADLIDLINLGVVPISAAGNVASKIELYSNNATSDYNNYFITNLGYGYYYSRGSISAAQGVICVGAAHSLVNEQKVSFSNCGPRIDVFAPGVYIMSSINSSSGVYVSDTRNSSYNNTKYSGTSMASPQVAGVIACLAEIRPKMRSADALDYLIKTSTINQLYDGIGTIDLQGAPNRYLRFVNQRPLNGQVGPIVNIGTRKSSGMVYPRTKIFRYGK